MMPLTSADLRQGIRHLFDSDSMPSSDAIGTWVAAYIPYAQAAVAGAAALSSPLPKTVGDGPLFFDQLDSALRTMWTGAVWAGPALTAVTTLVPPLQPFLATAISTLTTSYDREQAATLIAEALHTYTLSVVVTVTPASGTPAPTTLV